MVASMSGQAATNESIGTFRDNVSSADGQNEFGEALMHESQVGYRVGQFVAIHVGLTKT